MTPALANTWIAACERFWSRVSSPVLPRFLTYSNCGIVTNAVSTYCILGNYYTAVDNKDRVLEDCPWLFFGPHLPSRSPCSLFSRNPALIYSSWTHQTYLDFVLAVPCVWNDPTLYLHLAYPFTFSGLSSSITFAQKQCTKALSGLFPWRSYSYSLHFPSFCPHPLPLSLCPALTSFLALYSFFVCYLFIVCSLHSILSSMRVRFWSVPRA